MQNTYSPPHITKEKTETQGMWFSGRVLVHHAQGMGSFLAQTTKPDPRPHTTPKKNLSKRAPSLVTGLSDDLCPFLGPEGKGAPAQLQPC